MDLTSLGQPSLNPQKPAPNEQAQYLRLLSQSSGSEQLKRMISENQLSDDELVQFIIEHPEELQGPRYACPELKLMLLQAGLGILEVYGSYERTP